MRYRSKTLATWLAVLGGTLGLHRLYLNGPSDVLGWLHLVPTALGLAGVIRMRQLGQDDTAAWLLIPLLGLMISLGMLCAILYGLTPGKAHGLGPGAGRHCRADGGFCRADGHGGLQHPEVFRVGTGPRPERASQHPPVGQVLSPTSVARRRAGAARRAWPRSVACPGTATTAPTTPAPALIRHVRPFSLRG